MGLMVNSAVRFLVSMVLSLMVACVQVPDETEPAARASPQGSLPEMSGDSLVRMELADIHGTLPELGYRDLLSNGQVVHLGENRGTASIDARLRRLLLSTVDYRRDRLGDVEVDVQRIRINRGFRPLRLP